MGEFTITPLVLAGGRSERMGRDKRLIRIGGVPLVVRTYECARQVGDVIVLVSDNGDASRMGDLLGNGARFLQDRESGGGPLAASAAGLEQVDSDYALLLAVDYPNLTGQYLGRLCAFLQRLEDPPNALIPLLKGKPQYLCAIYRTSLAGSALEAVENGERSMKGWVRTLGGSAKFVPERLWRRWGRPETLLNWNEPGEFEPEDEMTDGG